jgi:hypothetical protein
LRNLWPIAVFLYCQTGLAPAVPTEREKPKKKGPPVIKKCGGAILLNFQRLDQARRLDYQFRLQFTALDKTQFKETFKFSAGTTASTIRDALKFSIPRSWKMTPVGDFQLVIEGYKGSPVVSWRLTCEGLLERAKPTIRWLEEKKD